MFWDEIKTGKNCTKMEQLLMLNTQNVIQFNSIFNAL